MRHAFGVGAAALCAAVVLVGCSGGGAQDGEGPAAGVVSGSPVPGAASSAASAAPVGPEEAFNALALGSRFFFDGQGTASAAEAMKRYCDLLGEEAINGLPPAQWLAEKELTKADGPRVLGEGVSRFCPARAGLLKAAGDGSYERWFVAGTYEVGAGPKQMPAGSYVAAGALKDCYWERASRSGEVLDNQFATSAQEVRVTVRDGDGQFTSRGCGAWRPAS
ncbi:hypothetical protein ABZ605_28250 [Streptomyces sp. NPDC012765]|uniref:hypothetical protein n=1 Tax=Streptomyces sp. NPDC012765 TaxID=3155249 RepID=UPI0033C41075